ncbi:hypothetical protein AB8Q18_14715 [Neisseriaceae bacterium CLB008]
MTHVGFALALQGVLVGRLRFTHPTSAVWCLVGWVVTRAVLCLGLFGRLKWWVGCALPTLHWLAVMRRVGRDPRRFCFGVSEWFGRLRLLTKSMAF